MESAAHSRKEADGTSVSRPPILAAVTRHLRDRFGSDSPLKAAEVRLQFSLTASGFYIWELDIVSDRLHIDDAGLAVYGIDPAAFRGEREDWEQRLHPEDRELVLDHRRKRIAGDGASEGLTFRIVRPDGAIRTLDSRNFVVCDPGGKPRLLTVLERDITSDLEIRETLRLAEERLALALNATNESVWDWSLTTDRVYRDRRWAEMVGLPPDKVVGDRAEWIRLVHPDDIDSVERALLDHLARRTELYVAEMRLRTTSGNWIWTMDRGKVVSWDKAGRPLRMVGTQCDITQSRVLEERIRHSEEISIQVSQLARIGAWEHILATNEVTWSPELFRLCEVELGFIPNPAAMDNFFPAETRPIFRRALERALTDGQSVDLESPFLTARGRSRWVRVIGRAEVRDGRAIRIFGAIQDITDTHDAEESHRKLEAQLFQVQRVETLGTLAGGIAHDFNNLLTGIIGYEDLALDTLADDHPSKPFLAEARQASLRARELVEQILTFSRLSGAGQRLALDMESAIDETSRFLRATVPATIEIDVEIREDCGRVLADSVQIHQLLLNLGTNAAHAMRGGKGVLRMSLERIEIPTLRVMTRGTLPAGPYLRLSVSDTGHGIDPETQRRIFDPFFTTKQVGEGTGLGLAVVDGIARSHGGAVEVESALGAGTRFDVYLPAVTDEVYDSAVDPEPTPAGAGQTVCIVDDEAFVAQVARTGLERHGYRAVVFTDPAVCLEALRRNPSACSILITDQTMPGITGLQLAASVRQFAPELPIVIMSGYFSKISTDALKDLGNVALLPKPFTLHELARQTHQSLQPGFSAPE